MELSIFDRVREIIVNQLGISEEKIVSEAKFIEDLGADSLDQVELIMALEEEFGRSIPDENVEQLTTVGSVVEYIEEQIKQQEIESEENIKNKEDKKE